MKYISVGYVHKKGYEFSMEIAHAGFVFPITGVLADLWLRGSTVFSSAETPLERQGLNQLERMGLVVRTDGSPAEEYRALTCCTLVPVEVKRPYWFLTRMEATVLRWLRESGLHLSMAELNYLIDRKVPLEPGLLGMENAQALVQRIYTTDTIFDNILESQMESAQAREYVVRAVLRLLRKKRIVLL